MSPILQNATHKQSRVEPALCQFLSLVDKRPARKRANENNREWWPNLNSNWKNQTRPSPLVLPDSDEVNLKVNHGDIRVTSQALPMPRAIPKQREAVAVTPVAGGRKRSSAQECAQQPTRHPWQLHAVLHQQQQYLITYAASSASHWTNNDPLDQGRYEAGQLPVEFFLAGWPG